MKIRFESNEVLPLTKRFKLILFAVIALFIGVSTLFAAEGAIPSANPTPAFMNFIWALVASAVVSFGVAVAVRFTIGLMDGSLFGHLIRSFVLMALAAFADFTCYALWSDFSWVLLLSGILPLVVVYQYLKHIYYYMRRGVIPMYSGPRLFVQAALVAIGPLALWLCHFCHVADPSWFTVVIFWIIPAYALAWLGRKHEMKNFEHLVPEVDLFNLAGAKKLYIEECKKPFALGIEFEQLPEDERLTKYAIDSYTVNEEKEEFSNDTLEGLLKSMIDYLIKDELIIKHEKNGEVYYVGVCSKSYHDLIMKETEREIDKAKAEFEEKKGKLSGILKETLSREFKENNGAD